MRDTDESSAAGFDLRDQMNDGPARVAGLLFLAFDAPR
jgi:hypothetical protein